MARKIKPGAQRPPLSQIDKILYTILILLSIGLWLFTVFFIGGTLPNILHRDSADVIIKYSGISFFTALPMWFIWFALFYLFCGGRKKLIPIIGNPDFKSSPFSHTIKVYPLRSPQYKDNFTNKERRTLKRVTIFLAIWIPICLIIYPMGIYPRKVYLKNDTLVSYNMFNQEKHLQHVSSAESLYIHTYVSSKSYTNLTFNISFQEEHYTFFISSKEDLENALYIKGKFPDDRIKINTTDDELQKLIYLIKGNDREVATLLYELVDFTTQ